ncbi:MAG: hypothetical protein HY332_01695 [Chloroflexi bacterium]|nr:hypothetical protein [Chloroflexota bacterium]
MQRSDGQRILGALLYTGAVVGFLYAEAVLGVHAAAAVFQAAGLPLSTVPA